MTALIWRSTKRPGADPICTRSSGPRRFGYLADEAEAQPAHRAEAISDEYAEAVLALFQEHGHLSDNDPCVRALAREWDRTTGSVSMVSGQFLGLASEGAHGFDNTSPAVRRVWERAA